MYEILSNVFEVMLGWHVVASDMQVGSIVPVLKKPTLNPNMPGNYRPITISTTYSKLFELYLLTQFSTECGKTQFGFREGMGIDMACSFMHDVVKYFNSNGSPVFSCSLDAEKCFDRIWHSGLFYKLQNRIVLSLWLTLFEWYTNLRAVVKWNDILSETFKVTRGIRQGSLLSPILFTYFIDDLLTTLSNTSCGLRIVHFLFNNFAYADDVNLLAATVPDLQKLMNICFEYSKKWRFVFGFEKTKCTVFGKLNLSDPPSWN